MTEQEWLSSKDPQAMLEAVSEKISDRKLRLFACGCVRQVWHLLADERSCNAVEVAEKFSDGLATDSERAAARAAAWEVARDEAWKAAWDEAWKAAGDAAWAAWAAWDAARDAAWAAWDAARAGRDAARAAAWTAAGAARAAAWDTQARLLRDIVGNPFRPHVVLPRDIDVVLDRGAKNYLTPTILSLAAAAYEERDPTTGQLNPVRLAILADALEEVGCENKALIDHLRSRKPHVRGCWAIDLILGKE